jgi:hypothetical protein
MQKRKCNFTDDFKAEFPFLKEKRHILPVDIETVVNKIFEYFCIYTVRVEELKEFGTFVDTEYKHILSQDSC